MQSIARLAAPAMAAPGKSWAATMSSNSPVGAAEGVHYQHTDDCRLRRWTSKESFEFMAARPWHRVAAFYADLVRRGDGPLGLARRLGGPDKTYDVPEHEEENLLHENSFSVVCSKAKGGRWDRVTFKLVLSYHGSSFDGWQKQPGLNTVQGLIEKSLGIFIDERKLKQLKEKSLPIEGCAVVAGRTDKGVTALQQVSAFYTWRKDVESMDILEAVNGVAPDKLKVLSVSQVCRSFHPNFAAKWRRYIYIFPLIEEPSLSNICGDNCKCSLCCRDNEDCSRQVTRDDSRRSLSSFLEHEDDYTSTGDKPRSFSVSKVNQLLRQLEGKLLSYRMFARDTQAGRSSGPPTECFMFHSGAMESMIDDEEGAGSLKVMCVELVANRFLRKMVRVLVATAIREAAAGAKEDSLLRLMEASCRRATAPPAPPEGLCLVDVGYGEFKRGSFLVVP